MDAGSEAPRRFKGLRTTLALSLLVHLAVLLGQADLPSGGRAVMGRAMGVVLSASPPVPAVPARGLPTTAVSGKTPRRPSLPVSEPRVAAAPPPTLSNPEDQAFSAADLVSMTTWDSESDPRRVMPIPDAASEPDDEPGVEASEAPPGKADGTGQPQLVTEEADAEPVPPEAVQGSGYPGGPMLAMAGEGGLAALIGIEAVTGLSEPLAAASLRLPRPRYPAVCRRRGEEGTVVLVARIGGDGSPEDVSVFRTSGFARLDRAAVAALREADFTPALNGGLAVGSVRRIAYTFRLYDEPE